MATQSKEFGKISQRTIDEIDNLSAIDVIGTYLTLDRYNKAICPFHDDHSPSLQVTSKADFNGYHCFVCKASGGNIKFVGEYKKLDFRSAILEIASDHHITVEYEGSNGNANYTVKPTINKEEKVRLMDCIKTAQAYFTNKLRQSPEAIDYIKSRGFKAETVKYFGIGYAAQHHFVNQANKADFEKVGIIKKSEETYRDTYFNRLTIPFFAHNDDIIGWAGRIIAKENRAKYINPVDTIFYQKSNFLYNYHRALATKEKDVWVVESYTNVMRMYELGYSNVVATCGTAFTDKYVSLLAKFKTIHLCYDADEAGRKATRKTLEKLLPTGASIFIYELPEGEDLDTFGRYLQGFNACNKANVQKVLDSAKYTWLDYLTKDYKPSKDIGKEADFIKEIVDCILLINDKIVEELYVEQGSTKIRNLKKAYKDRIKSREKEAKQEEIETAKVVMNEEGIMVFNTRGFLTQICDYQIKLMYQLRIKDRNDCKWILKIWREGEQVHHVTVLNKELHSVKSLKEILFRERYPIDLDDKQLTYLLQYLLKDVKHAEEVVQIGWHSEAKLFFFANVAYCPDTDTLLIPNEVAIVEKNNVGYFMPYTDSNRWQGKEQIRYKYEKGDVTLREIADFMANSWDEQIYIALSFYMATLFVDIVEKVNPVETFFPLLYLKGAKSSGKSILANSLSNFFGHNVRSVAFGSTTDVAIPKQLAMYSGICNHLEDYGTKREGLEDLTGMLSDFWGRRGRTKTDRNNIDDVESMPVRGTAVVTSNILPVDATERFHSRLVFLLFNVNSRTSEEKAIFDNKLSSLTATSWTHITCELLKQRQVVDNEFKEWYSIISQTFKTSTKGLNIVDRVISDYSQITAVAVILLKNNLIDIGIDYDQLINIMLRAIKKQHSNLSEQNPLLKFWEIVQTGYDKYIHSTTFVNSEGALQNLNGSYNRDYIIPNIHYRIDDSHTVRVGGTNHTVIREKVLKIKFAAVYEFYQKQCSSLRMEAVSYKEMRELLKEHSSYDKSTYKKANGSTCEASFIASLKMKEVSETDGETKESVTFGFALKYSELQNDFNLNLE